jgi:ArsR family transcriptional regulator, arsenate/arsenite/antimonite-responsive transcriptional repressor
MTSHIDNTNKFKAKIFKALSDPVRLSILDFLRSGEKCVCEIVPHVNLIQPVVSRHLKILKDCGIVKDRKEGNRRHYSITEEQIFKITDYITPEVANAFKTNMLKQLI